MYSMISYWLKYYRHECGLTQQQVADRLKIERSTYTYYETGKTNPDSDAILRLADFFDVSTDYLLGRKTVPESIENSLQKIEKRN